MRPKSSRRAEVMGELRRQQTRLLKLHGAPPNSGVMTKQAWVAVLQRSGLDDDDMKRWHQEFERTMPRAHGEFLESLGIDEDEVERIREWSR